ncbi:MAG: shikimate dehydrogenase [Ilumatobacteraceae bacterium]
MTDRPPVTARTRVAAVIGSPVRHSLSPAIHQAAFEAGGLDWTFVAFEVAPGHAAEAVRAARTLGLGGLAVTTPHKEDVAVAVDEVDPAAAALGSVNTVVVRADGTTFGASTDGDGFVDWLRAAGHDPLDMRVVVLGAGAAARSVIDALDRAGVADIAVVNRSEDAAVRAAALARRAHVAAPSAVTAADLVVNATSVGMGDDALPLDPALLRASHVVADLVYHPLDTALLRAARAAGAATVDGLGMLVHQAALQQQLWTGTYPDVAALRAAAESQLP